MARQAGRFLGKLRLTTQNALDQLKDETELSDLNLPDLRVGSLRAQARDYVRDLMDIEGQMEELRQAANSDPSDEEATPAKTTENSGPPPVDLEATRGAAGSARPWHRPCWGPWGRRDPPGHGTGAVGGHGGGGIRPAMAQALLGGRRGSELPPH